MIETDMKISKYLYFSIVYCKKFKEAMQRALQTDRELINYIETTKPFYRTLHEHTGYNGTYRTALFVYMTLKSEVNIFYFFFIFSPIYIRCLLKIIFQVDAGLQLPDWTRNIFPDGKLKEAALMEYIITSYNDELKRLTGGFWLKLWLDNINDFINFKTINYHQAYFYSGHDVNISSVLRALGIFESHIPPYNSAIMFELHKIKRKLYVKVNNKIFNKKIFIE